MHHTFDAISALKIILENIHKHAMVMIAIPEYHGWYKRFLQRLLILEMSDSEEDIIHNAKKYFQLHLNRAVKYGLREERNIIFDTFVNPQIETNTLEDICGVFFNSNIEYYSAYPTLNFFLETSPWSKEKENKFNYQYYQDYYKVLERIWMCSGENNIEDEMGNFESMVVRVNSESKQLNQLENKILEKNFSIKELQPIQNGYLGLGMNYFVGVKSE